MRSKYVFTGLWSRHSHVRSRQQTSLILDVEYGATAGISLGLVGLLHDVLGL